MILLLFFFFWDKASIRWQWLLYTLREMYLWAWMELHIGKGAWPSKSFENPLTVLKKIRSCLSNFFEKHSSYYKNLKFLTFGPLNFLKNHSFTKKIYMHFYIFARSPRKKYYLFSGPSRKIIWLRACLWVYVVLNFCFLDP